MRSVVSVIIVGFSVLQGSLASSICATVTDLPGHPLHVATVRVVSLVDPDAHYSSAVDASGKACIDHLPEGLYSVEAGTGSGGFLNVRYYPVRVAFPDDVTFSIPLPYGEIREGGVRTDAVLSGTLLEAGRAVDGIKICLRENNEPIPAGCTVTNDLGQYALVVPPGKYRVELARGNSREPISSVPIELPTPGLYRNEVSMPQVP